MVHFKYFIAQLEDDAGKGKVQPTEKSSDLISINISECNDSTLHVEKKLSTIDNDSKNQTGLAIMAINYDIQEKIDIKLYCKNSHKKKLNKVNMV